MFLRCGSVLLVLFTLIIECWSQVVVDLDSPLWKVEEKFLSVAIDSHVVAERWKNFDFNDRGLRAMAAALAPAYLRLGGTAADLLIFETNVAAQNQPNLIETTPAEGHLISDRHKCWSATDRLGRPVCEDLNGLFKPRMNFTMSGADWTAISGFARDTGLTLLFDANALLRHPDGSWDSSNAKELLDFVSCQGGINAVTAWELGNEPNSLRHALNVTLPASSLGRSFETFRRLLSSYPEFADQMLVGPDVNAVAKCLGKRKKRRNRKRKKGCKALRYLSKFLSRGGSTVDAVTWHHYYLNGHTATLKDFTHLKPIRAFKRTARLMRRFLALKGMQDKPIWLGEAGSAFGGGAKGLSDRYVASLLWLERLGMSAAQGVNVVIRQSFYHGSYGMIGEDLLPNSDFWLALAHKSLIGRTVLRVTGSPSEGLRLYAHCARRPLPGVVLFGINFTRSKASFHVPESLASSYIEAYVFSPGPRGLRDRQIAFNGVELRITSTKEVPPLTPVMLPPRETLGLNPFGTAFWHFPTATGVACQPSHTI